MEINDVIPELTCIVVDFLSQNDAISWVGKLGNIVLFSHIVTNGGKTMRKSPKLRLPYQDVKMDQSEGRTELAEVPLLCSSL